MPSQKKGVLSFLYLTGVPIVSKCQTREKGLPLSAPPECESSVISGCESISLDALLSLPHILGPSRLLVHLGIKCRREGSFLPCNNNNSGFRITQARQVPNTEICI